MLLNSFSRRRVLEPPGTAKSEPLVWICWKQEKECNLYRGKCSATGAEATSPNRQGAWLKILVSRIQNKMTVLTISAACSHFLFLSVGNPGLKYPQLCQELLFQPTCTCCYLFCHVCARMSACRFRHLAKLNKQQMLDISLGWSLSLVQTNVLIAGWKGNDLFRTWRNKLSILTICNRSFWSSPSPSEYIYILCWLKLDTALITKWRFCTHMLGQRLSY